MPQNMASMLSQPAGAMPDQGGGAQQAGAGSLLQALQQPSGQPGGQGGPPGVAGGGTPALDAQHTAALVYHLNEFEEHWKKILSLPDIGKRDIKGPVLDMMADVLADGLVTLPQAMNELKAMPTDPLGQRQWAEAHYQKTIQVSTMVLQHHAAMFHRSPMDPEPEFDNNADHQEMMGRVVNHYGGQR